MSSEVIIPDLPIELSQMRPNMVRRTTPHALGVWYVRKDGLVFCLFEAPRPIMAQDHFVGPALLADGSCAVLTWGPETRALPPLPRVVRWFRRFTAWITNRPLELTS